MGRRRRMCGRCLTPHAVIASHERIDGRRDKQGEQGADAHPGEYSETDVEAASRSGPRRQYQWQHADHHRRRRHQYGSKAHARRLFDGLAPREALVGLKAIGEVMYSNFDGADLRGANLSQMTFHDPKKFNKAVYDKDTRWPAKLDPVAAGAVLVTEEIKK